MSQSQRSDSRSQYEEPFRHRSAEQDPGAATMLLMVGLPGAGKTTRAKELAAVHRALRLTPDHYTQAGSDRAIIEAVVAVAAARRASPAQVALAWLRRNPAVVAPLVGATKTSHIDDAVASLELELTDEEAAQLEGPYTPRYDFQGVSDDAELARISARLGIKPADGSG